MQRNKLFIIIATLVFTAQCPTARADSETNLHVAAHLGTAFAVDTIAYGIYSQNPIMSKGYCRASAFITTLFVGMVYEIAEDASRPALLKATGYNALGAGLAGLTQWAFHF